MTHTRGKPILSRCRGAVARALGGLGTTVRGVGFWTGILLPLLYLPLLLVNHSLVAEVTTLGKLIVLHVAALFVGNGYAEGAGEE